MNENPNLITNRTVKQILKLPFFFSDLKILVKILSPIRTAIMNLEAQSTTLADCFIQFVGLAAAIKKIPNLRINEFKNYCKQVFNKRWNDFNTDIYLLAYFLHPGYRGMYIMKILINKYIWLINFFILLGAGLRESQFQEIARIAIQIWKNEDYDEYECANLIAYMRLFRKKEDGFDLPYSFETDNPLLWWMTNYAGSKSIGKLAIKIFSITPHSADCERTFSALGWIYGKR